MTGPELKNYFREKLVARRRISQEYEVLDAIVDFISQALTEDIPEWEADLVFQTDGTDDGKYCLYEDDDGVIRFWKTLVDDNEGNAPPTDPDTHEDAFWIEVSPGDGSAIKEWAAGIYGAGLVIVYFDHSVYGRNFWLLTNATRPYESANIEDEIEAGDWARIGLPWYKKKVSVSAAALKACGSVPVELIAAPGANKFFSHTQTTLSKKAGAEVFAFADSLVMKDDGGDVQYLVDTGMINIAGNVNLDLVKQGQKKIANAAFILTTLDEGDSATGDEGVDIILYYTIEDVKV